MSLAALANGTECGPMNPLQGLTKNLNGDRGLQQVRAARLCSRIVSFIDERFQRTTLEQTGLVLRKA